MDPTVLIVQVCCLVVGLVATLLLARALRRRYSDAYDRQRELTGRLNVPRFGSDAWLNDQLIEWSEASARDATKRLEPYADGDPELEARRSRPRSTCPVCAGARTSACAHHAGPACDRCLGSGRVACAACSGLGYVEDVA